VIGLTTYVNCHCERKANWKLQSFEVKPKISRNHWYSRNIYNFTCVLSVNIDCLNRIRYNSFYGKSSTVAKSRWIQIMQYHNNCTNFELQVEILVTPESSKTPLDNLLHRRDLLWNQRICMSPNRQQFFIEW